MNLFQTVKAAVIAIMLVAAFSASSAHAQAAPAAAPAKAASSAPSGGVAVLNLKKTMNEASSVKAIRSQLEKKSEEYKKIVGKEEERLRKREKELVDQRSTMSAEAFEKERRNFQTEMNKFQLDVQKKRIQLARASEEALSKVEDVMSAIVKDIAKENSFAMVFRETQIVFYADFLDITNEVLKRLNQKLPDVKIEIKPISDAELTGGKPAAAAAAAPAKKN
jgi:Skp family chaperone for outer membrane proteins